MKVIFAGTPANAASTLNQLVVAGYEVVTVLTREDSLVGRKKVLTPSAVADKAHDLKLPLLKANQITDQIVEHLQSLEADLGIVVAYGSIFKTRMLQIPQRGWLNVHYSLLPRWRGAAPVQNSILAGDSETGVTVFQLDEGMDTGPIWTTARTLIEPRETAGELLERLSVLGVSALLEAIPKAYFQVESPTPQASSNSTLASKPNRLTAKLNFTDSAIENELKVRAMNPDPMAWCLWRGEAMQVITATALGATDWAALSNESEHLVAGAIQELNGRVLVVCRDGSLLEIKLVKPSGKTLMDALAWRRGFKRENDWLLQ